MRNVPVCSAKFGVVVAVLGVVACGGGSGPTQPAANSLTITGLPTALATGVSLQPRAKSRVPTSS